MNRYARLTLVAILFFYLHGFVYAQNSSVNQKPQNVILLIGDGMGLSQVYASYTVNNSFLNILTFPVIGLSKTNSLSDYVTDSGAGGTAISTGKKTKNGCIAVDSVGNKLTTLVELSEAKGLSTGIISTSAITHATPASFVAHCIDRDKYETIAEFYPTSGVDVFIGGGLDHFTKRKDKQNLVAAFEKNGYSVYTKLSDYSKVETNNVVVLAAPEHMAKESNGRGDFLPEAVQKCINQLNSKNKGFFMMAEGSQIDWGGHANDLDYITSETIDFDKAVGIALAFAKENKNTLVIVTADHETGGLTLPDGDLKKASVKGKFSTFHHTAMPVPVYAYGPGAELFTGFYENVEIFAKISALLNLK